MGRLAKTAIKINLCFLLLFGVFQSAATQTKVKSVNFIQSEELFRTKHLYEKLILKSEYIFSREKLQADLENIREVIANNCYPFAEIRADLNYSPDSNFIDINYNIDPKKKYLISDIVVTGNTFISTRDIILKFLTQPEKCLNTSLIESDIENLIKVYENNGYPFVKVSISDISREEIDDRGNLKITIEIDEGPQIKIDQIKVEGNSETKAAVVIRETQIRYGEIYDQRKIDKIRRRLRRLNIFNNIDEPEIFIHQNPVLKNIEQKSMQKDTTVYQSGGILINVTEGNTNRFDGIIGYLPGFGGESGYFTGLADIGMRNLFGTGRKLFIKWLREDRYSQEIGLRYVEPWFLNYPVNIGGYFFQRQQDTTYIKRAIEFKSDFQISDNLSISALFNQEQIIPSSEISNQFVRANGKYFGGLEAHYDIRDDIFNPTEGVSYRTDYRFGRKKIYSINQVKTIQKYGIDIEWAIPVVKSVSFAKQVCVIGLHGRDIKGTDVDVSDLYRFGGTNSLRGYRENQFIGSRVVWSNTEYRFLTGRRSFVFGFFDLGYYFRQGNKTNEAQTFDESVESFKYGYGVGLRFETALGIIGVSFALGKGDNFDQAKIHFGLISEF